MSIAVRQSRSTGAPASRGYVRLELPFLPPSANEAYPNNPIQGARRGRYKSRALKDFLRQFQVVALSARERPILKGPFELRIWVNIDRRSDITNRIKAVEDALVSVGLVPDDRWADRVVIERDREIAGTVIEAWGITS